VNRNREQKLIDRYLQGLTSQAESGAVETRLERDKWFRRRVEETRTMIGGIKTLGELSPPHDLVAAAERRFLEAPSAYDPRIWRIGYLVAAGAAALLLALLASRMLLPTPALEAQMAAEQITGDVWIASENARAPAKSGIPILAGQRFVVGGKGSVTFRLEGRGALTVGERSQLTIIDPGPDRVTLVVEQGALRAAVRGEDLPPLNIRIAGLQQRVEIRHGTIGVLVQAPNSAVVACEKGEALLELDGNPVTLAAGFQMIVGDQADATPVRIAEQLRLQIEPVRGGQMGRSLVVSGKTDPGAEVWVNEQRAVVDGEGRFTVKIHIAGHRQLVVSARDALLRRRDARLALDPTKFGGPGPVEGEDGEEPSTTWQWLGEPG